MPRQLTRHFGSLFVGRRAGQRIPVIWVLETTAVGSPSKRMRRFASEDLPELNSPTSAMRSGRAKLASMRARALMMPGGLTPATACSFRRARLSSPAIQSTSDSQAFGIVGGCTRGALRAANDMTERRTARSPLLRVWSAASDRTPQCSLYSHCISQYAIFPWQSPPRKRHTKVYPAAKLIFA
jgi:hypothetical protein